MTATDQTRLFRRVTDDQGREWGYSILQAYKGMKYRALTMEEHEELKALAERAQRRLAGLPFPDSVGNATFDAVHGAYNKTTYRQMGFNGFYAIRRLSTALTTVRKIAGKDEPVAVELAEIIAEMKEITGKAPKGL